MGLEYVAQEVSWEDIGRGDNTSFMAENHATPTGGLLDRHCGLRP